MNIQESEELLHYLISLNHHKVKPHETSRVAQKEQLTHSSENPPTNF
jgi:hypothetical protein